MNRRELISLGLGLVVTANLPAAGSEAAVSGPTTNGYTRQWWKEAVVYQVYPRSFQDSNGDGIGDLKGVTQRLDYIKALGVNVIWLCPHYDSPNADNGYDIRDYRKVMTEFGDMADFDQLLAQAKARGMRLIIDLVANHSSDEHAWFRQSRLGKDNPYRDYYIWRPGKNGGPPNNWPSWFGGSAWEQDGPDGEYYLHLFARKQPDLNWDNPKVREEIYAIMRFWLDKGVDGFRMDVIPFISKDPAFLDMTAEQLTHFDTVYGSGPHTHDYIREMNDKVLAHYDVMTVGEAAGVTDATLPLFIDERRNELDLIFQFDIVRIGRQLWRQHPWQLAEWKAKWDAAGRKTDRHLWNTVFMGNHDHPRMVNKFGNAAPPHWQASAKLLATLLLTQKGTPFLFQGDEIGMTNYPFAAIDEFEDVEVKGTYHDEVLTGKVSLDEYLPMLKATSRDNARTPMQWSDAPQAGFSVATTPWFPVNPNYREVNVARQDGDPVSILNYYRTLIRLRGANPALVYGDYEDLDPGNQKVFCYTRTLGAARYLIVLNMSDDAMSYALSHTPGKLVLGNMSTPAGKGTELQLRPWEARIYRRSL